MAPIEHQFDYFKRWQRRAIPAVLAGACALLSGCGGGFETSSDEETVGTVQQAISNPRVVAYWAGWYSVTTPAKNETIPWTKITHVTSTGKLVTKRSV
jgi:hypothetical protein